ncbi:hypothetical protein [Streptomyces sp. NPDC053367]|uniref:hypothetical protein n=1 Tax=Streptomyces sp. NPDC053367 TaxID=3365700 RepID=UPI0037D0BDB7
MHVAQPQLARVIAHVIQNLGVSPAAARHAVGATIRHFDAESTNPAIINAGLTSDEYLQRAVTTRRFTATFVAAAVHADGREADARLVWAVFLQREASAARTAHRAVPATAPLGSPGTIRRIGKQLGLPDEITDQLTADIVLNLAMGYPYRSPGHQHLSLTDLLGQVTVQELADMLHHSALVAAGHAQEAATALRRMQRGTP